jgi:hypothetical protein
MWSILRVSPSLKLLLLSVSATVPSGIVQKIEPKSGPAATRPATR